ncbi:MAG: transposase [Syntrophobacteraceae bacterium]|nr:transposase [Desulfobacteraceae bacterium]
MREKALSSASQRDRRTRQHLMERSFAKGGGVGFKRARWRRLWRVQIQEYLTAAIQNIMTLVQYVKEPRRGVAMAMGKTRNTPHLEKDSPKIAIFLQSVPVYGGAFLNFLSLSSVPEQIMGAHGENGSRASVH